MPYFRSSSNLTNAQKIERALLSQVSVNQDPDDLKQLSKVMGEEASRLREAGQRYRGHELIKHVADFKARVKLLADKRADETFKRKVSSNRRSFLLSSSFWNKEDFELGAAGWDGGSTLALEKSVHRIRYIVSKISLLLTNQ